jgi:hypothetical protein
MDNFIIGTGLIYRNPKPHVLSRQAYFPSVAIMDNGEMVASMAIGEAFEAVNLHTFISRSDDMGETWSDPVPLFTVDTNNLSSDFARITALPNGRLVANVVLSYRDLHPEEGLANPENIGMVPTDLFLVRSNDYGKTWDIPELITAPLIGPSFEQCCPILPLRDGRWLWPTSTWRGWDGYCPNGMKMVALVSSDQGKTWPEYMNVMNRSDDKIIYWESKIIELKNGLLLAVAWTYDEKNGEDLTNHYSVSRDGGKTWLVPTSAEIHGETMAITELSDGSLLCVYRRMDKPGLWATIARLDEDIWINEKDFPLWGAQEKSLLYKSDNMVQDFNELKFGAPCISILPDNSIFIAFWCYEKMVSNIRWFKLVI